MTAPPNQFPDRWRLNRAGILNVWHYFENTFDLSGGRLILRGTNGSGKSRALEMLLPFLLDADRRKMDATGSGRVNLDELMRVGSGEQRNRAGYLWLELKQPQGWLTIGALLSYSGSANKTQVWYFTTTHRVGHGLELMNAQRDPLSLKVLTELIGEERVTKSAETHRERIRAAVFGLSGDAGRDRFRGLMQLIHTLRAPDVGQRIDEGRLPQILSDSLPPLEEQALARAGEKLDGLTTTREALHRIEQSRDSVRRLLSVYQRYAAFTVLETADAALRSVHDLDTANREAAERRDKHDRLRGDFAAKTAEEQQLRADVAELQNAINGIKGRAIFKQADDLVQRDHAVAAFAGATDRGLAEAERERTHHANAVGRADSRLAEVRDLALSASTSLTLAGSTLETAELAHTALPEEIRLVIELAAPETAVIRRRRDLPPDAVERPVPQSRSLWPPDPTAAEPGVRSARDAATRRHELARLRLLEARRLGVEESKVLAVEADASRAHIQAAGEAEQAAADAGQRDDRAVELAMGLRTWFTSPMTTDLLGQLNWFADEILAPLALDVEALTGDNGDDLSAVDSSPARLAQPAHNALASAHFEVAAAQRADDESRSALLAEAAALRRAEDPLPPRAPWLTGGPAAIPFWLAVDFVDHVSPADRAGIEGALLAAGLLTAALEPDGTVRAADGTALLSPAAMPAVRPLVQALRPDPAAAAPAELVRRVLAGIGLDDDSPTSVSADGSWRNGPARGRHVVPAARHIGAAARAQARRDRLADIDAALAVLDTADAVRTDARATLENQERRLEAHLAAAPRTTELYLARRIAERAASRAERSRAAAIAASTLARETRTRWAQEVETHRNTCIHHGLPIDPGPLERVADAAADAIRHTTTLLTVLSQLAVRIERHSQAMAEVDDAITRRDEAESRADDQWRQWSDLAVEVAALHEAIGLDVEQARLELARSQHALEQAQVKAERARSDLAALGPDVGRAEEESRQAAVDVTRRTEDMIVSARTFSRRLTLPGLAAAATTTPLATIDVPGDAASVRAVAAATVSGVARPAQPATVNSVFTAFQTFDRDVSGQLDPDYRLDEGIALITVAGASDDHTLSGAGAALEIRLAEGRVALTEREREVFTTFVLGGVADELRRRINQATGLVTAMNASLRSIRTSNGIGIRLNWRLSDDSPELSRVAGLVATADAVRTAEQNDDLVNLLRRRVEEFYAADPSAGYATHLSAALDYRSWHDVDVTILGPEPDQQRRISARAKLSQGETRFVSYVTLFAAADAYFTGLSPTAHQLRLILLDDAFALVDDPTVGELMGLLVHLDLDFVMTGHALWGCFSEVPRLDVYEVRRLPGTSAVTTHVHWDGRTRHLRSTG